MVFFQTYNLSSRKGKIFGSFLGPDGGQQIFGGYMTARSTDQSETDRLVQMFNDWSISSVTMPKIIHSFMSKNVDCSLLNRRTKPCSEVVDVSHLWVCYLQKWRSYDACRRVWRQRSHDHHAISKALVEQSSESQRSFELSHSKDRRCAEAIWGIKPTTTRSQAHRGDPAWPAPPPLGRCHHSWDAFEQRLPLTHRLHVLSPYSPTFGERW